MASFVTIFNQFLFFIFSLCYMYQAVYAVYVLVVDGRRAKRARADAPLRRYAVLISGRNEELVIGELVKSLKDQDYPEELLDIYVIADNCTDGTAEAARAAGAEVFERFDQVAKGKSHALDYALHRIANMHGDEEGRTPYAGYFVFDADNVVDPGFVRAMNATFNEGFQVLTSYRNSKNYDSNWVSAGSALWFLREAKFLSNARYLLGSSCAISGTGFLISADILETDGGWIHHLLTEDIEFSTDCISHGIRIGYCRDAVLYDEQPTTFRDSWRQRLRWAKGFYQVLIRYGRGLLRGICTNKGGRWACFDMFMTIAPAMLLTIAGFLVNLIFCLTGVVQLVNIAASVQTVAAGVGTGLSMQASPDLLSSLVALMTGSLLQGDTLNNISTADLAILLSYGEARSTIASSFTSLLGCFASFGLVMFAFGTLTTITEWKQIHAKPADKVKYLFTFPFFMLTYVPIAVVAVFTKVEWKPITHNVVRSTADIVGKG